MGQKPGLWEESESGPLLSPFSSKELSLPDPALHLVSLCWVLRKGLSNSDAHRAVGTESEVTTVHAGSRFVGPGPRLGPVGTEGHLCEEGSMVCIQQVLSKGAAYLWPPRGSSGSRFLSHRTNTVKERVPPTGPRAPPRSHWDTVRWAVPWVLLWPLQSPGPAKGRTHSFVHSFIHSPCLPSSVGKGPSGTPTSPLEFSLPGWHRPNPSWELFLGDVQIGTSLIINEVLIALCNQF